jgi:hypothetical protein
MHVGEIGCENVNWMWLISGGSIWYLPGNRLRECELDVADIRWKSLVLAGK